MKRLILSAIALSLFANVAIAQDSHHAGQWIARAGIGGVFPKSNNLKASVGTIEADDAYSLTLTGVYMLTDNIGLELLASAPWSHDITLDGAKVGNAKQLPPTLSMQWYTPAIGRIHPYLGVGLNWTMFFSESTTGALAGSNLELDDSFGVAVQGGMDWDLSDRWLVNADLRWINIESDVKLDGTKLGNAKINPIVFSLNVGYKF